MPILTLLICLNNHCSTAHVLDLCVPFDLSHECTTTYEGGDIVLGAITYPSWAIGNDQWFTVTIDEPMSVTIDLLSNYSHPLATWSNQYGWNEGIRFIMYEGSCDNLTPVLFTAAPLGSGQYCGANEYTTTSCVSPLPHWSCSDCLDDVEIGSIAYLATLTTMPQCCNGWTSQCNNRYLDEVTIYNASLQAWVHQNGLGEVNGLCPFDPTVQNVEITMNLTAGTYYFQVFPFENAQVGYVSEGEGTLNVCGINFLDLPDDPDTPNPIEVVKHPIQRPRKIYHPRYGVLIEHPNGRVTDLLNRRVKLLP